MMMVMYSNRYKKGDEFLKDIDFSLIRDILYSYSEEARDRFFENRWMALLFHHYFVKGWNTEHLSNAQDKSNKFATEQEMELRYLDA